MPFCTAAAPEPGRRPVLLPVRHPAGRRRAAARHRRRRSTDVGRVDRDDPRSARADKAETRDRQLNPVDAAAVDALPPGHALLVVQRGPGSGSRFLLDQDVVTAGRHPDSEIFLDDMTVSRRHAEFHRARRHVHRQPTSAASTAPTSTATGSTRSRSPTATRCRSASTAWCSSPATHGRAEP